MKLFSGRRTTILAALLVLGGCAFGQGAGIGNPIEEGRRLSDPARNVFAGQSLSEFMSAAFVLPESSGREPLTFWLNEDYRRTTLKDHLDIFVPPPEHLAEHPIGVAPDLEAETLAPVITLTEKDR